MESQIGLGDVGEGISLRRSSSEGPEKGVRRYTPVHRVRVSHIFHTLL